MFFAGTSASESHSLLLVAAWDSEIVQLIFALISADISALSPNHFWATKFHFDFKSRRIILTPIFTLLTALHISIDPHDGRAPTPDTCKSSGQTRGSKSLHTIRQTVKLWSSKENSMKSNTAPKMFGDPRPPSSPRVVKKRKFKSLKLSLVSPKTSFISRINLLIKGDLCICCSRKFIWSRPVRTGYMQKAAAAPKKRPH